MISNFRHQVLSFRLAALVLAIMVAPMPPARAVDDVGRYIGYGPGGKRCEDIYPATKAGQEALLLAWLAGFITAENYHLAGTKDLLGDQDVTKAWQWVRQFCETHKSASLADVAALLALNKMDILSQKYATEAARIKTPPLTDRTPTGSIHSRRLQHVP